MLAQDDDPTTADLPVTKLKITDLKEFVSAIKHIDARCCSWNVVRSPQCLIT